MIGKISYFNEANMTGVQSSQGNRQWRSRAEILRTYLDGLSPDDLYEVRPAYYWQRFGSDASHWRARKANFDPNQPRAEDGRWTDEGNQRGQFDSAKRTQFAARSSRQREAECETQYKLDSAICRMVRTPLCWEQAMKRRAACISGYPLPPLNF
jgi:hypothetical protein